jgi:hypothetical protein
MEFADSLSQGLAMRAREILEPLARGHIVEPTTLSPASAADDPLNPNKFRLGTPAELRGSALWALARIGNYWPKLYEGRLGPLIENGNRSPLQN